MFEAVPPVAEGASIWTLRTRGPLERDVLRSAELKRRFEGEFANLTVKCTMVDPQGTKRELSKSVPVRILDEDDNGPFRQDQHEISVDLNYAQKVRRRADFLLC